MWDVIVNYGFTLLFLTSVLRSVPAEGKWTWGSDSTSTQSKGFTNSRILQESPTTPEEGTSIRDAEPKLRSLCSLRGGSECPDSSKDITSLGKSDMPTTETPFTVIKHHHIHTHMDEDLETGRERQLSRQFPHQQGQAFLPFASPTRDPSLQQQSFLPQANLNSPFMDPKGQPSAFGQQATGFQPLFSNPGSQFNSNIQTPPLNLTGQSFLSSGQQGFGVIPPPVGVHMTSFAGHSQPSTIGQLQSLPIGLPPKSPVGQSQDFSAVRPPFIQGPSIGPNEIPNPVFSGQNPVLPQAGGMHLSLGPPGIVNGGSHLPALGVENLAPHSFSGYPEECHCVHPTLCGTLNVVRRTKPQHPLPQLMIDPRTKRTDIVSNETGEISKPNQQKVDVNNSTSDARDQNKRLRRNLPTGEGSHLLASYAPGQAGCQLDHVCCRDPYLKTLESSQFSCGERSSRGLLGRTRFPSLAKGNSEFGEHPWQGAVLKELEYVCGAILITDRHVLTAAHCVNSLLPSALMVRLGEWDVAEDIEFLEHLDKRVAEVHSHPQYYSGNLRNDIAVLTFQSRVDLHNNPHISPVCLPTSSHIFEGQRCISTGWGKDAFGSNGKYQRILKEVEVPIVSRQHCQESLRRTRLGKGFSLQKGMICAGGEESKDACTGDGGGPLVCLGPQGTAQLAGIVSWGIGCGEQGIPGVYVDVPYYMDWILTYLRT